MAAPPMLRERGHVLSTSVPLAYARLVHASACANERSIGAELRHALKPYFSQLAAAQQDTQTDDLDGVTS
jgi:hypothetical protein